MCGEGPGSSPAGQESDNQQKALERNRAGVTSGVGREELLIYELQALSENSGKLGPFLVFKSTLNRNKEISAGGGGGDGHQKCS